MSMLEKIGSFIVLTIIPIALATVAGIATALLAGLFTVPLGSSGNVFMDPNAVNFLGLIKNALSYAGGAVLFATWLWLAFRAYKVNLLWCIGCLVLPIVAVIFEVCHWDVSKRVYKWSVVGFVLMGMSGGLTMIVGDKTDASTTSTNEAKVVAPKPGVAAKKVAHHPKHRA